MPSGRALSLRGVVEEHVLGVPFVEPGEDPAGCPAFAMQQVPHRRVRRVGGDEHPGCGRVLEGRPHKGPAKSPLSPARCDKQQVNEVTLVEVARSEGKKPDDLAALYRNQAAIFPDQSPDLPGAPEGMYMPSLKRRTV